MALSNRGAVDGGGWDGASIHGRQGLSGPVLRPGPGFESSGCWPCFFPAAVPDVRCRSILFRVVGALQLATYAHSRCVVSCPCLALFFAQSSKFYLFAGCRPSLCGQAWCRKSVPVIVGLFWINVQPFADLAAACGVRFCRRSSRPVCILPRKRELGDSLSRRIRHQGQPKGQPRLHVGSRKALRNGRVEWPRYAPSYPLSANILSEMRYCCAGN